MNSDSLLEHSSDIRLSMKIRITAPVLVEPENISSSGRSTIKTGPDKISAYH